MRYNVENLSCWTLKACSAVEQGGNHVNIVVAMKQVPDLQQVRIRNRQPVLEDVPLTMGNIDKNALEAAVLIKENAGGKVIVLAAGSEELEDTIKEALAAGADEAVLIMDEQLAGADGQVSAMVLAAAIRKMENVDLILFGEGSADNYSGQVGSRVAELLDIPQAGYASRIEIEDGNALITRALEDGEEILEVPLPAAVMVIGDLNEPRIPSVSQILKAGKKPKEVIELDELKLDFQGSPEVITVSNLAPQTQRKNVKLGTVADLVKALQSDGVLGR